jgi:hypothetical protein
MDRSEDCGRRSPAAGLCCRAGLDKSAPSSWILFRTEASPAGRGLLRRRASVGADAEHGAKAEVFAAAFAQEHHCVTETEVAQVIGKVPKAHLVIGYATGQLGHHLLDVAAPAMLLFFPFDAAQAGDVVGAFLFPPVEGRLDDAEFLGDVAEAFAGGAEFYEFIFDFVVVHIFSVELRVQS